MALVGPPEIRNPYPAPSQQQSMQSETISDPFMSLMVDNFNKTTVTTTPPKGLTENQSGTFLDSGNPCLDFFFQVVPGSKRSDLFIDYLCGAWAHDPLTTLKLICNMRGVRGTGKSDKEGFYTAAIWLHSLHPKTFACNVAAFADFGYIKDLPEILYRLLLGAGVRLNQKNAWRRRGSGKGKEKKKVKSERGGKGGKQRKGNKKPAVTREIRIANAMRRNKIEKEKASSLRKEKKISMAQKALLRYTHDPDYRFLYDRVSDYFAESLKKDMKLYECGEFAKVSLAAKWCPSIDSSFDRAILICENIARKVFPKESYPEYEGLEDAHYAYRVRDRLRKDVLVPLRKVLELPEVYIGANKWDAIPYNRVASVAMKFYKEKFLKHDPERFNKYLEDVKAGKAKIAAGALLPHEVIGCLNDDDGGQVAELQWKRIVDDLMQKGKMRNCMAVCDVSGSMTGIPMEVSVALGILVSELSEEPWKGKLITFSENPELQVVEGDDLRAKTEFVRGMAWGGNTDFQKVFDLILLIAVNGNLKPEQMIKRLFVFSDMEFDKASFNPWETDYEMIVKKYTEKGYGSVVPEIVFWNLRDSKATPVPGTQKGVALVSGFSKNLLTIFLDNDGELNPIQVMEAAISGEEYQKLVVVD
ncbi:Uncharacterized conserved protein UCP015417, vWA [Melia azedarach]|uniref:Uncharacterized conserved protein UCP015417, vWA n=1 Tax=Melia azedarach TaxID=155640 RepID=A0ACC1XMG5_MELAZ|nr:Uncharacterized conserved protein UCP015417, vWA [Melia azedarach]